MNVKHPLPEQPVRSKGEATLLPDGCPELPAVVCDISPSGIGVLADRILDAGTAVDVHVHGHAARGIVASCRPAGAAFYIAIALAA